MLTNGAPIQFGVGTGVGGTPLTADVSAAVGASWSGGESADQVVVHGFVAGGTDGPPIPSGGDTLTFSVSAWGTSVGGGLANAIFNIAAGGTNHGLVEGDLATIPAPRRRLPSKS